MVRLFQMINSTTSLGKQTLLMTFPFLRFLAPEFTGWNQQKEVNSERNSSSRYIFQNISNIKLIQKLKINLMYSLDGKAAALYHVRNP